MSKFVFIGLTSLVFISGLAFFFATSDKPLPILKSSENQNTSAEEPADGEIRAKFLIYTNGTRRDFCDSRYHNLSNEVFISPDKPSEVVVLKEKTTWNDFFMTLPMKITKECLTTGTGQVFCSNETKSLKFYINDILSPGALTREIEDRDRLLISFGSEVEDKIELQLKTLSEL